MIWAIGGLFSVARSVETVRPAQALPGSAPCGARTFLEHLRTRDHPADSILLNVMLLRGDGGMTRARYPVRVIMLALDADARIAFSIFSR